MKMPFRRVLHWPLLSCLLPAGCAHSRRPPRSNAARVVPQLPTSCARRWATRPSCAGLAALGGTVGAAACYTYATRLSQRQRAGRPRERSRCAPTVRTRAERRRHAPQCRTEATSQRRAEAGRRAVGAGQPESSDEPAAAKERERLDGEVKVAAQQAALQRDALERGQDLSSQRKTPSPTSTRKSPSWTRPGRHAAAGRYACHAARARVTRRTRAGGDHMTRRRSLLCGTHPDRPRCRLHHQPDARRECADLGAGVRQGGRAAARDRGAPSCAPSTSA